MVYIEIYAKGEAASQRLQDWTWVLALSLQHCFGAGTWKEWGVVALRLAGPAPMREKGREPRNCSFVLGLEVSFSVTYDLENLGCPGSSCVQM